jgi:hypothetical protein
LQVEVRESEFNLIHQAPPYLRSHSISSLWELKPLFDALVCGQRITSAQSAFFFSLQDSYNKLSVVEDIILQDFPYLSGR